MATTETFFVSSKTNILRKTTEPTREYFRPGGKKEGQAKYIIEVFGYNHADTAREVKKMVEASGMGDKLFTIRVETR